MAAAQAGSDEAARGQTTRLLRAVGAGEASAKEQLLPLVYDELHRLAGRLMAGERRSHTLQPTALMNEAFLRLVEPAAGYDDRGHFLRVAATAMRRVLVDHARARGADKRRGDRRVELDADLLAGPCSPAKRAQAAKLIWMRA